MEQARKHLKLTSFVVLALAVLSLLNAAFEVFFGELNNVPIPEGAPENILLITKIFVFVIALLLVAPQIYIGAKGLRIAKNPNASKSNAHIVWGIILLVITIMSMISPALAIVNQEDVFENGSSLLSIAVDAMFLYDYVKYAKMISKA